MSKTIEEILTPKPEARPRIYAYSIDDQAHKGLLKVGQTSRDVKQLSENVAVKQSQRDCVLQPRVGPRAGLPWVNRIHGVNPNGVVAEMTGNRPQPRWGWESPHPLTQGSACRATLGFGPESRWDSPGAIATAAALRAWTRLPAKSCP